MNFVPAPVGARRLPLRLGVILAAFILAAAAGEQDRLGMNEPVGAAFAGLQEPVLIGRPFAGPFVCSEHFDEPWQGLGNALGRDCYLLGARETGNGYVASLFAGEGRTNAEHYSWHAELLAPFDATVIAVAEGADTNTPGVVANGPSGHIVFERGDGTRVVYAHVINLKVAAGTAVKRGEPVAQVAAAGTSRQPHVHIGAWRGAQPLTPQFDLLSVAR